MMAKAERGYETIGGALASATARLRAAEVETPRLDAEVLLAEILGVERWRLVADAAEAILPAHLGAFQACLARREAREPVAYILGRKEFWSLDLAVSRDVLIPRPETECLVEAGIRWLRHRLTAPRTEAQGLRTEKRRSHSVLSPQSSSLTVVDLGTGAGTILLAVASEVEGPRYVGTDVSPAALGLARRNAKSLGLAARIELVQGDLFEPLAALRLEGRVDILISNPPYVSEPDMARLAPEIREYEPALALGGGPDGLDVIRRLIAEAPRWLGPSGALLFEFGDGQANECLALLRSSGAFGPGCIVRDLGGWPRAALAPLSSVPRPASRVPSRSSVGSTRDSGRGTRDCRGGGSG